MEIINQFLDGLIDSFKMKNPKAFAVVSAVILGLFYVVNYVLGLDVLNESLANTFTWIANIVLVPLLALLGAHTPKPPIEQPTAVSETERDSA